MKYASGETPEIGDFVKCVSGTCEHQAPFELTRGQTGRVVGVCKQAETISLVKDEWWNATRFCLISRAQTQENPMPCINYPTPATRRFDEIPIGRLFCFVSPQDQVVRKKMSMHTYVNLFVEGRADFSATLDECRPDRQVYCLVTTSPPEFTASTTI